MADVENSTVAAATAVVTPKKKASKAVAAKTSKVAPKSSHPPTAQMVNTAVRELKEAKGSSLQAIKKYIVATYKVDGEKLAPFIRKYLRTAVTSGILVQTKGKGASGSFKLPTTKSVGSKTSPTKKRTSRKEWRVVKKVAAKENASAKKPVAAKKAVAAKKPVAKKAEPKVASATRSAPKRKSLTKTKKSSGAKPKAPKPKKVGAPKSAPRKK